MRIRIMTLAVLGLLFGLTRSAPADIPTPLPAKKEATAFKIEVDEKAKGPKLIIPQGVFTAPRVRPGPKRVEPTEKGEIPIEDGDGIAGEPPAQPRNHLLIAGVALTLSLAFGGVWFMRRKGGVSTRSLVLLITAGSSLAIGTLVWADIPVPPRPKVPPRAKEVPLPVLLDTKVQVEFVYGSEPIRLIIDSETLEKLKKEPKLPEVSKEPAKPTAPPEPK